MAVSESAEFGGQLVPDPSTKAATFKHR
jgi:hypothetical protein